MFHGSMVALVTPMHPNGSIDIDAFDKLIDFHLENKTDGLVVLGTTGESPCINAKERDLLISHTVTKVANQMPVIVGTGSNCTRHSIELTEQAQHLGADAALVVTPYYNKPTQAGLVNHFTQIAKAQALPIILYNVPGRTITDLLPETVSQLLKLPNIVGIKEATGDLKRLKELQQLCDNELDYFSGDDPTACEFVLQGGKGVISVTANVMPALMHVMIEQARNGDKTAALESDAKLQNLHHALFVEANPIPVKWALAEMGLIKTGIRSPLTELTAANHEQLRQAMIQSGCL